MEKEGGNAEDVISQLSNTRLAEPVLLSLFGKLQRLNLPSNLSNRALKMMAMHCIRDKSSQDLQIAALTAARKTMGENCAVDSEKTVDSSILSILEFSLHSVVDFIHAKKGDHAQTLPLVFKSLEVLSEASVQAIHKVLGGKDGTLFLKNVQSFLQIPELQLSTLGLLERCLSLPENDSISKIVDEQRGTLIEEVYPLLFDTKQKTRQAALPVMRKLKVNPKPPCWDKIKTDTQKKYCTRMVEMVKNVEKDWPTLWQFTVTLFGVELHSGAQLINHMLEVLERAYKHTDFEWTRVQAFVCWKTLIDNFRTGLSNPKRVQLLLIPLRASNHRTQSLTSAKLDAYVHLLSALGRYLTSSSDVVRSFLAYCFGSEKDSLPPVKSYPALHGRCAAALDQVLDYCGDQELFQKVFRHIVKGVGECVLMNLSATVIGNIWNKLLKLVNTQADQESQKEMPRELLNLIGRMVASANPENSTLVATRSSPSSGTSHLNQNPNVELGALIVTPVIYSIVTGTYALKPQVFTSTAYYTGTTDVMTGTPALLFIDWLLTPGLLLGGGSRKEYIEVISKMITFGLDSPGGFMTFLHCVLKRIEGAASSVASSKMALASEYLSAVWCILAENLQHYMDKGGEIDQGHATESDYMCTYAMLVIPAQHLYLNVDESGRHWSQLYRKASTQAALGMTMSNHEFCEQVANRLAGIARRPDRPAKQTAAVFRLLTLLERVESSDGQKSTKRWLWVQQHMSQLLKEMTDIGLSKDEVFVEVARCVRSVLTPLTAPSALCVLGNIAVVIHALLKQNSVFYDAAVEVHDILSTLHDTCVKLGHSKDMRVEVKHILSDIITVGQNHSSQKLRGVTQKLLSALNDKSEESDSPPRHIKSPKTGTLCSPAANSPLRGSPNTLLGKTGTSIGSPTTRNNLPNQTGRKLPTPLGEPDVKFVRIETPPRKILLTEHQKEVMREKRNGQDIPALYQDLTQDTQSLSQDVSQDCIPLSSSVGKVIKKSTADIEGDDAAMDVAEINESIQVLPPSPKSSPKKIPAQVSPLPNSKRVSSVTLKKQSACDADDGSLRSFTPPAGFIISACKLPSKLVTKMPMSDAQPETTIVEQKVDESHEKEDSGEHAEKKVDALTRSPHRRKPSLPSKKEPTVTRNSVLNALTTRSGKVLKRRQSLAPEIDVPKRKLGRKSLPAVTSGEIKKIISDKNAQTANSAPTTDTKTGGKSNKVKKESKKVKGLTVEEDYAANVDIESTKSKKNMSNSEGNEADSTKETNRSQRKKRQSTVDAKEALSMANTVEANEDKSEECTETKAISHKTKDTKPLEKSSRGASLRSSNLKSNVDDEFTKDKEMSEKEFPLSADLNDSEDIIESSQEPCVTKKLTVNLESFKEPEPNGKLEIDNIILLKGPDPASPFKVVSPVEKDIARATSARRLLALDSPDTPSSPSASLILKVSENLTPLTNKPDVLSEDGTVKPKAKKSLLSDCEVSSESVSDVKATVASDENQAHHQPSSRLKKAMNNPDVEKDDLTLVHDTSVTMSARNGSMPEWMHAKKDSPQGKLQRLVIRRSTGCMLMKSIGIEGDGPASTPCASHGGDTNQGSSRLSMPTSVSMEPSSPPQSKKNPRISMPSSLGDSPSGKNPSTSIIKRSGRAAQLLGLGQAAAARGGETVVSNVIAPVKELHSSEEKETTSTCGTASSTTIHPSSSTASAINNNVFNSVVASPSLRKRDRLFFKPEPDSPKSPFPSASDDGSKEEWIPNVPRPDATPDSSILKRKFSVLDTEGSPSPSRLKKKRVSFRDPPLSKMLAFNGENSAQAGFVITQTTEDGVQTHTSNGETKPEIRRLQYDDEDDEEDTPLFMRKKRKVEGRRRIEKKETLTSDQSGTKCILSKEQSKLLETLIKTDEREDLLKGEGGEDVAEKQENCQKELKVEDLPKKQQEEMKKEDVEKMKVEEVEKMEKEIMIKKKKEEEKMKKEKEEKMKREKEEKMKREEEEKTKREEEEKTKREEEEKTKREEEEKTKREEEEKIKREREKIKLEEDKLKKKKEQEEEEKKLKDLRERKEKEEKKEKEEVLKKQEEEKRLITMIESQKRRDESNRKRHEEELMSCLEKLKCREAEKVKMEAEHVRQFRHQVSNKMEEQGRKREKAMKKWVEEKQCEKGMGAVGNVPKEGGKDDVNLKEWVVKELERKKNAERKLGEWVMEEEKRAKLILEDEESHHSKDMAESERQRSASQDRHKYRLAQEENLQRQLLEDEDASELMEIETQGMLDNLHRVPSTTSPVFPSLMDCKEPIEIVCTKLTCTAWHRSLLRELKQQSIYTIGALASLTEERIMRLPVKYPRKETVCEALKELEIQLNKSKSLAVNGGILMDHAEPHHTPQNGDLKSVLAAESVDNITEILVNMGREKELCHTLSSESMLDQLIERLGVEGLVTDLIGHAEKQTLRTVVSRAGTEAVIDALRPQDIGAAIGSKKAVLIAVPPDSVAETYFTQVKKTSGKKERNLTVDQLSTILRKTSPETVHEVVCPADRNRPTPLRIDVLREYVIRESDPTDILKGLNEQDVIHYISKNIGGDTLADILVKSIRQGSVSELSLHKLLKNSLMKLDHKEVMCMLFSAAMEKAE